MILTKKTLTETEDKLMIYHAFWSILFDILNKKKF